MCYTTVRQWDSLLPGRFWLIISAMRAKFFLYTGQYVTHTPPCVSQTEPLQHLLRSESLPYSYVLGNNQIYFYCASIISMCTTFICNFCVLFVWQINDYKHFKCLTWEATHKYDHKSYTGQKCQVHQLVGWF